ncbi:glycogen-binding subunit 76A [Culicoides brevitarsis]|uniref:glycogen-binding subunit 76A n=1 Tax=Culicoides brevitarsis TaxID=469753 RepID=UPI00307BCC36
MNGPGDIPDPTERNPCGITSFIPLGMSCRGRAEAFARSLQSRLRTLGTQEDNDALQQDGAEQSENTWLTPQETPIQSLQPLRNNEAADAFFDFDLEPESPGSPIDECEYTRLIESATHTPHEPNTAQHSSNSSSENPENAAEGEKLPDLTEERAHGTESGYVCASPCSSTHGSSNDGSQFSSHNSSEIQYYDPAESSADSTSATFYDCIESRKGDKFPSQSMPHNTSLESPISPAKENSLPNGHVHAILLDSDSCSESLPPSQSTTDSNHTYTALSSTSASNSTLQDENVPELQTEDKVAEQTDVNDNTLESKNDVDVVDKGIAVVVEQASPIQTEAEDEEKPKKDANRLASITETDEEEDFVDDKPQRLRRCSSLKTGKTPPGTPGRKKGVRFADVLGLDLADVKTFLDHEVPKIPKSAYEDLEVREHQIVPEIPQFMRPVDKILVPLFQQPGGLPCFLDKVREKQVSLENCAVTDPVSLTICGMVRVRNLDFHKSVYIRYTLDNWKSFSDIQANYVNNSCDGFSDKFSFTLFGNSLQIGQRIEIAVRFHCKGQQFWDNNYDSNYCFQCLPVNQQPKPQVVRPPLHANECSGAFY